MVAQQGANWDRNEAFAKVESIILENPDIKGIICGNDDMALGAIAAVKAAGRSDIVVTGFDGISEAVDAIKKGEMLATAMDQVSVSATMCVDQMHDFITTGTTGKPEKQLVPCLLIDKSNADKVKDFDLID
jgi:erythritol transport system substrate-binding protein